MFKQETHSARETEREREREKFMEKHMKKTDFQILQKKIKSFKLRKKKSEV
jgi:hypothetical protein